MTNASIGNSSIRYQASHGAGCQCGCKGVQSKPQGHGAGCQCGCNGTVGMASSKAHGAGCVCPTCSGVQKGNSIYL